MNLLPKYGSLAIIAVVLGGSAQADLVQPRAQDDAPYPLVDDVPARPDAEIPELGRPFLDYNYTGQHQLQAGDVDYVLLNDLPPGVRFYAWIDNAINESGSDSDNNSGLDTLLSSWADTGFEDRLSYDDNSSPVGNGQASAVSGVVNPDGSIRLAVTEAGDPTFVGQHGSSGFYQFYVRLEKINSGAAASQVTTSAGMPGLSDITGHLGVAGSSPSSGQGNPPGFGGSSGGGGGGGGGAFGGGTTTQPQGNGGTDGGGTDGGGTDPGSGTGSGGGDTGSGGGGTGAGGGVIGGGTGGGGGTDTGSGGGGTGAGGGGLGPDGGTGAGGEGTGSGGGGTGPGDGGTDPPVAPEPGTLALGLLGAAIWLGRRSLHATGHATRRHRHGVCR